ncbi:MAG: DUF362 domain-containing protein, partial [Bacteroides sp.]|nr:DUF362 domain-containing protein [Bacteroides sp.]
KVFDRVKQKLTGKVGLKIHFGEAGNTNYISPTLVEPLAKATDATLVESNVLYVSKRRYTDSHIEVAKEHGYTFAPIDIMDAEGDFVIKAKTKHYNEVRVGKTFDMYDSFLVVSHFKGHMLTGFGGAIKNVSMGFASVSGKMALHASTIPITSPEKCIQCGACVRECPGGAISLEPLAIDPEKCIGCGRCIGVCPVRAFDVPWMSTDNSVIMERLCDYVHAIAAQKPMTYINVLAKISKDCDCDNNAHPPFMEDIGILASHDIVALEKACLDLVNERYGSADTFLKVNGVSGNQQITYAESLGLGSSHYSLVAVD